IPNNGGCFCPISLALPPGGLVNPPPPAAGNARSGTIKRVTCTMLSALGEAAPDRVPAPKAGELLVMGVGGARRVGAPFVTGELLSGGSGAGNGFDGVDAIETDATNCMNLPAEAMELEAPIRINRWCLKPDSGGPGTWRGGLGQIKEFEVLDDVEGTLSFSHRGERHFVAAQGMSGGGAGGGPRSGIPRRDGGPEGTPTKVGARVAPGDRLITGTGGGGGYGEPARRDAAGVMKDLADGKVGADEPFGPTGERHE